jgi:hypothetical protein
MPCGHDFRLPLRETNASVQSNGIGANPAQMISFMSYKISHENIYEDTTSDRADRNGIVIDTLDGQTI